MQLQETKMNLSPGHVPSRPLLLRVPGWLWGRALLGSAALLEASDSSREG